MAGPARDADGPIVVMKVGGSLLGWAGLRARLAGLLALRLAAGERPVLIAGGGGAADWVRSMDRLHALGEEASHWLALRAMDLNARVLASVVDGLEVVGALDALSAVWGAGRVPVLAPFEVLAEDDANAGALQHSWDVTSDSVAARVAGRIGAAELLLLKSAGVSGVASLEGAAACGLVDRAFPGAAAGLRRVAVLDLRVEGSRPLRLGVRG